MLDLAFQSNLVHTHLDWHEISAWLEIPDVPMRLAWEGGRLAGVMAASTPLNNTCWLRLIAISEGVAAAPVMGKLWEHTENLLAKRGVHMVFLLISHNWLLDHMTRMQFVYDEDIITLRRDGTDIPPPRLTPFSVRSAVQDDLPRMVAVDQTAFPPPWQLTYDDLHEARRMSISCTVATLNSAIVGYQLSTQHRQSGHLARLAALPEYQGQGMGGALLDDLIRRLLQRSIRTLTVNTQASNIRSQRLYQRYGFVRNGYDLPVWVHPIAQS